MTITTKLPPMTPEKLAAYEAHRAQVRRGWAMTGAGLIIDRFRVSLMRDSAAVIAAKARALEAALDMEEAERAAAALDKEGHVTA